MIYFVVCCYNSSWVDRCCQSVIDQSVEDWKMILIDDASDNKVLFPDDERITFIRNEKRRHKLQNLVTVLQKLNSDDIIFILDGDDWLAHNNVVKKILPEFSNFDLVWTNFRDFPDHKPFHSELGLKEYKGLQPRKWPWISANLSVFRNKLFLEINDKDLRDRRGEYFKAATDAAFMIPMLEMTGINKRKHLDEVMYIYNRTNPLSHGATLIDGKINFRDKKRTYLQRRCLLEIRGKTSYEER